MLRLIEDFSLAYLDTLKNEILKELQYADYDDLEDMVFTEDLTYQVIAELLDAEYIVARTEGYTLAPGIYEISDLNLMLKPLFPEEVKVNFRIDDIKLRSKLATNKTIEFIKKSSFYTILGFTESHSRALGEIN